MRLKKAERAREHVDGLIDFDTQGALGGVDLTVTYVARVASEGRLDFGGSEFEPAEREVLSPELASPDDTYGWWNLEPGSYVIEYNESLELGPGAVAAIHPLPRLLRAGASHPTFMVATDRDPVETLITVGEQGCRIKENARVSRLVVMTTG
ncbi:MAG TPA: deoxycytidine triphosphate deaminase [Gemmatimonadota bacterium]|nr:deoxycytidine triphosphate deaminase [Gemmatimonadota bacterium]